ncbi:D-lactate dehydrogenase, partial [Haemophilus influenzae]
WCAIPSRTQCRAFIRG